MSSSFHQHQHQYQEMETSRNRCPTPCTKGCGFFGSPDTLNMCSVCFTKHLVATSPAKVVPSNDAEAVVEKKSTTSTPAPAALTDEEIRKIQHDDWMQRTRKAKENSYYKNRCAECFKKMGLAMRFECRCGKVCCLNHRNSEAHHCSFNYQRAGCISIIRENPLVEADKLRDRI